MIAAIHTMMSNEEKKSRNIGLIASTGIHGALLLVLFLLVAMRSPESPAPDYGIQLNFGLDDEGSGDIQPVEPNAKEENVKEESQREEQQKQEETTVKPNEVEPTEQKLVSDDESSVVVKEEKKETKPEPVKEKKVVVVEEKPIAEYKKEEQKEVKSDSKTDGGKSTTSHGDNVDKKGDKGDPEGSLDAKALYGKQGGGGGNGVSMSGFNGFDWPKVVAPSLPEEAEGVYEFTVKVDEQGDVISVTSVRRGLSLEAEKRFKDMIQRLEFIPKGANLPPQSEGKITFRVVSR